MQRGYSYAKQKNEKKLPSIRYILVIAAFIALALFIYNNFIKSEKTIIAGFNWTDNTVRAIADNYTVDIEKSQMYKIELQKKGDLIFALKDELGNTIRENRYLIGREQNIILELVSSTNTQCIVEADVTDIYYEKSDETKIGEYTILNDREPATTYIHSTNHNLLYYVYPGRYSKDQLPDMIPKDTKLLGLFFVDCENLDNEENLNSDIYGSIFYENE